MKKFTIKCDLAEHIGEEISLDCNNIREFFDATFFIFPSFRKHYLDKISKGVSYIFLDEKNESMEGFCADIPFLDSHYYIVPQFQASAAAGPMLGNFAMQGIMGYGMQKLANKLNFTEETGDEYEIITTKSFMYSSNENRTEQGTAIPIVYGQLKVGSLVVNSNVSNYQFNNDLSEIQYNNKNKLEVNISTSSQNVNVDLYEGTTTLSTANNFSSAKGINDTDTNERMSPASLPDDESKLSPINFSSNVKSAASDHGNNAHNNSINSSSADGGFDRKLIGPSDDGNRQGGHDHASNFSKPSVFSSPSNPYDYSFRPRSSKDICVYREDVNGQATNLTNWKVGTRGSFQKLESIAIYRSLDILSEGPIAGFAIPFTGSSSYSNDEGFEDDNGIVSLPYTKDNTITIYNGSDNTAIFGTISYDDEIQHMVGNLNTAAVEIINSGSGYQPNLDDHIILANSNPDNFGMFINVQSPGASSSAEGADVAYDDNAFENANFGEGVVSENKMFMIHDSYNDYNIASMSSNLGAKGDTLINHCLSFFIEDPQDWGVFTFNHIDNNWGNVDDFDAFRISDNIVTSEAAGAVEPLGNSSTPFLNVESNRKYFDLTQAQNSPEFQNVLTLGEGLNSIFEGDEEFKDTYIDPENNPVNMSVSFKDCKSYDRKSGNDPYLFDFGFAANLYSDMGGGGALDIDTVVENLENIDELGNDLSNFIRPYVDIEGVAADFDPTSVSVRINFDSVCRAEGVGCSNWSTGTASEYQLTLTIRYLEITLQDYIDLIDVSVGELASVQFTARSSSMNNAIATIESQLAGNGLSSADIFGHQFRWINPGTPHCRDEWRRYWWYSRQIKFKVKQTSSMSPTWTGNYQYYMEDLRNTNRANPVIKEVFSEFVAGRNVGWLESFLEGESTTTATPLDNDSSNDVLELLSVDNLFDAPTVSSFMVTDASNIDTGVNVSITFPVRYMELNETQDGEVLVSNSITYQFYRLNGDDPNFLTISIQDPNNVLGYQYIHQSTDLFSSKSEIKDNYYKNSITLEIELKSIVDEVDENGDYILSDSERSLYLNSTTDSEGNVTWTTEIAPITDDDINAIYNETAKIGINETYRLQNIIDTDEQSNSTETFIFDVEYETAFPFNFKLTKIVNTAEAIPISFLLRNQAFSEQVFDSINAAMPAGSNLIPCTLTQTEDAYGNSHSPRYLKFIPGSGSNAPSNPRSLIQGSDARLHVPNYVFQQARAFDLNDDIVVNNGGIVFDEDDPDQTPMGYYNPELFYRVEVLVVRVRYSHSGGAGQSVVGYKNTSIDCVAQISRTGVIEDIHILFVPDAPVIEFDIFTGVPTFTPLSIQNVHRPSLQNLSSSFGGQYSFQDIGFIFKIDPANNHRDIDVTTLNGSVSEAMSQNSTQLPTTFTNSLFSDDNKHFVSPRNSTGRGPITGVVPDAGTQRKIFNLTGDDFFRSNRDTTRDTQNNTNFTPASLSYGVELINLANPDYERYVNGSIQDPISGEETITISTGRLIGSPIITAGAGYLDNVGLEHHLKTMKVSLFDTCKTLNGISVNRNLRIDTNDKPLNRGYTPNSSFFMYGTISDTPVAPLSHTDRSSLFTVKIKVNTSEAGEIQDFKIINHGVFRTNGDIIDNENLFLCLDISEQTLSLMQYTTFENTRIAETFTVEPQAEQLLYQGETPNSRIGRVVNNNLETLTQANQSPDQSANLVDASFLDNHTNKIYPGFDKWKQSCLIRIYKDDLSSGTIERLTLMFPGLGFNRSYSQGDFLQDYQPQSGLQFKISTNNLGQVTSLEVDQDASNGGYVGDDGNLEITFSPQISQSDTSTITSINEDPFGWARSIVLNDTPMRDKVGRFNFSKFQFNFLGGYYQNGNGINTGISSQDIQSDYSKSLMDSEFRLPAHTNTVNYALYAPRNNGEKDYYYTHTIKNYDVDILTVSIQIDELHYVYEGDEEISYFNLLPLVGGIITYIFTQQQVAEGLKGAIPEIQLNTNTGNGGPAFCGGAVTAGPGMGMNASQAATSAVQKEILEPLIDLVSAGVGIIAALTISGALSKFKCGGANFLCFKVGTIIKNSGEIWPARIQLAIEYGLAGEDLTKQNIVIQGCATSSFVQDINLKLPDARSNKKERIVKIYRTTREFNPLNGITEARFKMSASVLSTTEHITGYFSYPNTAMIGTRINARDMPNIPKREYIIKGKLVKIPDQYSPQTGTYGNITNVNMSDTLSWTSNPAWIIYDLLTHPIYGMGRYGITEDEIDKWSFLEFSKICDEPVSVEIEGTTSQERRFMCNLYVDQSRPAYEYIKELLRIYNSTLNFTGGKIYINSDVKKDAVMLFNNSNVSEEGFSYSSTPKTSRLSACTIDYLDEKDFYTLKSEYFEDAKAIAEHGYSHIKIAGNGITRKGEALRLAKHKVYSKQMEKEIIEFNSGLQASYLRIGDVIEVADNNRNLSRFTGSITKVDTASKTIDLDIPISLLPSGSKILIQSISTSSSTSHPSQFQEFNIQSRANSGFSITLSESVVNIKPGFVWSLSGTLQNEEEVVESKQYKVSSIKESGRLNYQVVALEYVEEKYDMVES